MEPLTAFAVLLQYMEEHPTQFKTGVLAVTGLDPEQSLLYRLAQKKITGPCWEFRKASAVGSVFSAIRAF